MIDSPLASLAKKASTLEVVLHFSSDPSGSFVGTHRLKAQTLNPLSFMLRIRFCPCMVRIHASSSGLKEKITTHHDGQTDESDISSACSANRRRVNRSRLK